MKEEFQSRKEVEGGDGGEERREENMGREEIMRECKRWDFRNKREE